MKTDRVLPSSFRDPSGFLFIQDGALFRQVNVLYKENYEKLLGSGLYRDLVDAGLLIPHEQVGDGQPLPAGAYKVLKPEQIPFISYPYEWSFGQLQDAALVTLRIQKRCLDFGLSLKDCSAYNIQFRQGRPVLIDTLSFEIYREGAPWVAYRQFCQHFLAPLALMAYVDVRLSQLLRIYIDGVPLDLASKLLPLSTCFRFSLLSHIHLHASTEKRFAARPVDMSRQSFSRLALLGLIASLESAVKGLRWHPRGGGWADYDATTSYSPAAWQHKEALVAEFLDQAAPTGATVWDLGANTGHFSRIAGRRSALTVSFDNDPVCVETNYRQCTRNGETNILPLLVDLTNPSAGIGWANQERMSLKERGPADVAIALALIHHLAIGNNLPLGRIADFLADICHSLIIEFVPRSDSQVQRLLANRLDIFSDYTQEAFEAEFARRFRIDQSVRIMESERTLYLMRRRSPA